MSTAYMPEHGTESRYKGARNGAWAACRCITCVSGHTRLCTLRQLAHLAGTPPLYPAGPLVQHIQLLIDGGMSQDLIARRAEVSHTTVRYLMRGLTKSTRREKALRILAVAPGDFDRAADRPAAGTIRRIRAMYSLGHNPQAISAAAGGLAASSISAYANGHYAIAKGPTAAAIAAAYKTLSVRQGASAKARGRARRMGWHGPLAWGADIDNPAAVPDLDGTEAEAPRVRDDLRTEEIRFLAGFGLAAEVIAVRVDLPAKDVRERLANRRSTRQEAAA